MMHVPCTWLECEELGQMEITIFCEYFASKTFPRDICETFYFVRLSFLIHTFCAYTIYTHVTHRCWGVLLRENPNHKPWELEIVIPIYLHTFACGFSSILTSSISIPLRDCSLNTYYTLLECLVRFWCYWEVLEEAEDDRCNIELVAGSEELDKTQFQEVLLE